MSSKGITRINWIDNIKFLGIFLVIIGHCIPFESALSKYIYSFHMPLFFFLSGLVFNSSKHKNFKEFLSKKAKSILIPYFSFSIFAYIFWLLISSKLTKSSIGVNPLQPLIGIFYSNSIGNWMIYDGPLWFLTCLFLVEIQFYFVDKFTKNSIKKLIFVLLMYALIGEADSKFMTFRFPWSFDVSLTSVVFFGCGFIFKVKIEQLREIFINKKNGIIKVLPLLILSMVYLFNTHIEMNYNIYGNILYFYISALSGIVFYSIIFMLILDYKIKFINFIGRNTIILLSLHLVFINCVRGLIFFIFKIPMNILTNSEPIGLLLAVICIIAFLPICYFINNYMPFLIGRRSTKINI